MKSNMPPQKDFSKNPSVSMQRSVFNRTHAHKTTFDVDYIVPFYTDEILPGDSVDLKANIFARLSSTLGFPIMDNMFLDTAFFFVPNRILWDNWEKFMGAQDNPGDSIDFQIPQVTDNTGGIHEHDLLDYMGIPIDKDFSVSSLFARAYIKIYNDWFRDENLQDSITEYTGDGPELESLYPIQKRGKRHDYFTSCLPQPQKGDPVSIALTGTFPVYGNGKALGLQAGSTLRGLKSRTVDGTNDEALFIDTSAYDVNRGTTVSETSEGSGDEAIGVVSSPNESGLEGDLSGSSAISINDLRLAVATQQLLELDNRGGTRYFEILQSHFGVQSPDSRLQRPEYLGGSTQMVNVNPVTQTSESNTTFQGEQAAFGTASSRSGFSKSFVEHGVILALLNVRADLTYQQGINRMFSRSDRYDFYFPTFANLGEQAVLNKEIFYQDTPASDDAVFGYNEHWSELRYKPSQISGYFRSDSADTLDAWHLSQDFATLPVLNSAFITENVPLDRVLTVIGTQEDPIPHFIMDSHIEVKHARVMPTYSIPGLHRL